jgi:hypothetical protein
MKAPGPRGLVVVRRAFVTASLSLLIARNGVVEAREACWWASAGGRAMRPTRAWRVVVQARAAAVQSSAGRPAVRTRLLVILPSLASAVCAVVELGGGGVAVQQIAELGAGQSVGEGVAQGGVDLVGERVGAGAFQRPDGGALRVVPERERGGQVRRLDLPVVVKQRVDQGEADGVRFSAGADRAGDPGLRFGELLVGVCPGTTGWG